MTQPRRRSLSSRIAAETGRLLYKNGPFFEELYPAVQVFFDLHREEIIRKILPRLESDGKGGFVQLYLAPNAARMRLIKVYVDKDFRVWSADDGAFGESAFSLVGWLRGPDAPLLFFAAAAAKKLLPREARA